MNNSSKLISVLFAGVAVGAVIGLLLSPDKGEETRDHVSDWFNDLCYRSKEKANELAEKGVNAVRSMKSRSGEFGEDVERTLGL